MPGMPASSGWRLDYEGREMQGREALGRRSRKALGRKRRLIPGRQGSALKKAAALVLAASLALGGAITSLAEDEAKFNKWLSEKQTKIENKTNKLASDAKSAEKSRLAAETKIKEERAAALAEKKAAAEAAAREAAEAAAAESAEAAAPAEGEAPAEA